MKFDRRSTYIACGKITRSGYVSCAGNVDSLHVMIQIDPPDREFRLPKALSESTIMPHNGSFIS
jgi:hypothetical protein